MYLDGVNLGTFLCGFFCIFLLGIKGITVWVANKHKYGELATVYVTFEEKYKKADMKIE